MLTFQLEWQTYPPVVANISMTQQRDKRQILVTMPKWEKAMYRSAQPVSVVKQWFRRICLLSKTVREAYNAC